MYHYVFTRTEQIRRIVEYMVIVPPSSTEYISSPSMFRFFLMRTVTVCVNNGLKDAQFDSQILILVRTKELRHWSGVKLALKIFARPDRG